MLLPSQPAGEKGPEAKARAKEGQESVRLARDLLEGLEQEFPEVPPYREELAEVYANLGKIEQQLAEAYWRQGKLEKRRDQHIQALVALRRAEELADGLVIEFPAVPKHRVQSATVCRLIAGSLAIQQDRDGAEKSALKSIENLRSLFEHSPDLPIYRHNLWQAHLISASIHLQFSDAENAAKDAEELPQLWPQNADSYTKSATLLIRCAEAAPDRQAHFYDRATEILREGIDGQKLERKRLEQPAFDPLRDRDDFRRLLSSPTPSVGD